MLHQLAEKSGIITTGSVHSHLFRTWVMGQLTQARWNVYQIRYYVGKKIPSDDQTYLKRLELDIREMFPDTYEKYLTLRPEKVNEDVKKRIAVLERENLELKSRVATQTVSEAERKALDLLQDPEVLDYLRDMVKKRKASG